MRPARSLRDFIDTAEVARLQFLGATSWSSSNEYSFFFVVCPPPRHTEGDPCLSRANLWHAERRTARENMPRSISLNFRRGRGSVATHRAVLRFQGHSEEVYQEYSILRVPRGRPRIFQNQHSSSGKPVGTNSLATCDIFYRNMLFARPPRFRDTDFAVPETSRGACFIITILRNDPVPA